MVTKPVSLLDLVTGSRWFQDNRLRRLIFALALVILAILSVFPRVYAADVKLAPQESNTAGLSAILTQLGGNYAALLGRSQPIEVDLAVARSFEVKREVVRKLGTNIKDRDKVRRAILRLEDQTDVQAMRGNLIQITVRDRAPERALKVTEAYADAMQERLAEISHEATANKRKILNQRFAEAQTRLAQAEGAINSFRSANQLIEPGTQLRIAVEQLATAQGQLKAKQVELQTALQFSTPNSFTVQKIQAEIRALQGQVAVADQRMRTASGLSAAGIAPVALRYESLLRDMKFAQALYESYTRYLEGAAIEELTAQYNLLQIEPPFLKPALQFNLLPMVLAVVVLLLALASEFIVMRPPTRAFAPAARA